MKQCLLPLLLITLLASCGLCTDTTTMQWSMNIKASKKNKVFIKKYELVSITGTTTVIGEAWLERPWFYELQGPVRSVDIIDSGYTFCFSITKYDTARDNNYNVWGKPTSRWPILRKGTKNYVNGKETDPRLPNRYHDTRSYYLKDTIGIDTMSFILLERNWVDTTVNGVVRQYGEQIPYGEMIFRVVE